MAKKKKDISISEEEIINKIYVIRGHKVMLDSDLALLYQVETKVMNQSVKRNIDRFPADFMFEISEKEWQKLKKNYGDMNDWGGRRTRPFVFTEQGVAMLSGILNSEIAITINIQIMRIFIKVRNVLSETNEIKLEIEKIKKHLDKQSKAFEIVFDSLDELSEKVEEVERKQNQDNRKRIGYKN